MATLTVQDIVEAGLEATYSAVAADGDTFPNDSSRRTFVHVKNGGGTSTTVSVATETGSKEVPGFGEMTKSAISVDIPAGEDRFIGPFPVTAFGQNPELNYTEDTSVTIAVMKA